MAIGRPAAQVGLYHPTNSMWLGDQEADRSTTKLGWQLLEHQVDWDYFDEQSLTSLAAIENGGFRNQSGQVYRAIVVPSSTVISKAGLERFQAFVKAGGKLIFVGKTPRLVVDKTFLDAKDAPDLSFATLIEPSGEITPRVLDALPNSDVKLDAAFPRLTYAHRAWRDADMYFFFNESDKTESRIAAIAGRGQAQAWDLYTGQIHPLSAATATGDSVRFPLTLAPYETKVVVAGALPAGVAAPEPSFASGDTLAELKTDSKQFTIPALPAGKRIFLELADAHDYVRVRLNGKDQGAVAWRPYRWDVTGAVKAGANTLEIQMDSGSPAPLRLVSR
jgi:hypothetical protein